MRRAERLLQRFSAKKQGPQPLFFFEAIDR